MPVIYKTYKNMNTASKTYGQFYARLVPTKTMTYQERVANKLQSCILEQLLEGKKVQFGELGTFYLSAKCTASDTEENFNVGQNVKGLYLRFAPSRQDVNDLSSKTLKKKASFLNAQDLVESKKANDNGDDNGDNNG